MVKKILYALLIVLVLAAGAGLYVWKFVWNKQEVKVEDKKGITIGAAALAKEYNANEKEADAKYLNKPIEVSGLINEVDKNQDGGIMVVLQTEDSTSGVQCTMRDKGVMVTKGQNIVIKGFCSGNGITGVSLTGCVLK